MASATAHHVKMRNFEHSPAFLVFLLVPCVWCSVLCLLNNTKIGHWAFVGCRIAIHGCITRICDVMWSGRRDSHQYHAVQMTTANSCCCCRRHHRKAYFYRTPEMKQKKKKREIHRRLNKQNVLAIEGAVVEVEQLGFALHRVRHIHERRNLNVIRPTLNAEMRPISHDTEFYIDVGAAVRANTESRQTSHENAGHTSSECILCPRRLNPTNWLGVLSSGSSNNNNNNRRLCFGSKCCYPIRLSLLFQSSCSAFQTFSFSFIIIIFIKKSPNHSAVAVAVGRPRHTVFSSAMLAQMRLASNCSV